MNMARRPTTPTGHPDRTDRWTAATTLNRMVDYALYGHEGGFGCVDQPLRSHVPGAVSFNDLVRPLTDALLGDGAAAALALAQALDISKPASSLDLNDDEREGLCAAAIAFAALTPEFLLR